MAGGYLLSTEDRQTYKYHASYKTIGKAIKMNANTVRKYILGLQVQRGTAAQHTDHIRGVRFSLRTANAEGG